ncbi:glycosyltransferase family 2 protein [Patescibacteria group bacterium]
MPKIGIIIVSHNSRPYVDELFLSLLKVQYPNFEIIFIDNASTDGSADYVKQNFLNKFSKLKILRSSKNLGFAGGNNVGLEYLTEGDFDYAYLLNQDTIVEPDFLEKVLEKMEKGVASVQSLILLHNKDERINTLGNAIHFLGFGYCYGYGWKKACVDKYLEKWRARDSELNIAYGSGAGLLLNMKALKQVGFFDEDFFMYHDDTDLGWRLRLAGYKNVLAPDSKIYHKYKFSKSIKKYYWMERNRFITIFKNYDAWSLVLIMPALIIMEAGLFFFSFFSGWWREKVKVYEYFLHPENWRKIAKKRKKIQAMRKQSDKQISKYFVGEILFQDLDNWILRKIVNPLFDLYWGIIRALL